MNYKRKLTIKNIVDSLQRLSNNIIEDLTTHDNVADELIDLANNILNSAKSDEIENDVKSVVSVPGRSSSNIGTNERERNAEDMLSDYMGESKMSRPGFLNEKWNFEKKAGKSDKKPKKKKGSKKFMKESNISPKNENSLMFESYVNHLKEDFSTSDENTDQHSQKTNEPLSKFSAWVQAGLDEGGNSDFDQETFNIVFDVLSHYIQEVSGDSLGLEGEEDESSFDDASAPDMRDVDQNDADSMASTTV